MALELSLKRVYKIIIVIIIGDGGNLENRISQAIIIIVMHNVQCI